MARNSNPLLSQGERLAAPVEVARGGSPKDPPYALVTAKKRLSSRAQTAVKELDALPATACPGDQAVAVVTMHPRYISKSDYPADLIAALGGRAIGGRSRVVKPDQWGIKKHPDEALAEEIFVAAPRKAIARWAERIPALTEASAGAATIQEVEDFSAFTGEEKLRAVPEEGRVLLEVALHTAGTSNIVGSFKEHAARYEAEVLDDRRIDARGLTFVPVRIAAKDASKLADFAFVRVARGMPQLRPYRPSIVRSARGTPVSLGNLQVQNPIMRALVFDGGIPAGARAALSSVVNLIEPAGIGAADPGLELHGLGVTSAFLFGPVPLGSALPPPVCAVDHVRVLDKQTGANGDLMYMDVLKRITDYLDANVDRHHFINLSLGPDLAAEDDDITAWTASFDERFAGGARLATIAAGNSGERDAAAGLSRVQPPSDGVNVLSVGACDVMDSTWERAAYSSIGPGRTPGRVKPDGVEFGGSQHEPFQMLISASAASGDEGTSFAAPYVLRTSAATRTALGPPLGLLALRALMIHRANEHATLAQREVGWGRFESDPAMLATCEDDEAVVLYQGELPISEHLRCRLPMPTGDLTGHIFVGATLVIAPDVDPNNPSTYTRAGLEVIFRPNLSRFRKPKPGQKAPKHAVTKPFFSLSNMYGAPESALRDDAHKWEPCLKRVQKFRATTLKDPVFDVYYHRRVGGAPVKDPKPIPYAFVISLRAPKVPDFYNRVVRTYQNVLVPMQTQVQVRIR